MNLGFADIYVRPWLAPFPIAVGALALSLFAFLAAIYLALTARSHELREDFRRRAFGSAIAVFVTAFGALLLAYGPAATVARALMGSAWSLAFQGATAVAAVTALWSLWRRRFHLARLAAAVQVSLVLWGWALVQYPMVLPPSGTIRALAAPRVTLELLLWALLAGSLILLPSLAFLFRTFGRIAADHGETA